MLKRRVFKGDEVGFLKEAWEFITAVLTTDWGMEGPKIRHVLRCLHSGHNLACTALPLATVPQAQERGVEPHLPVLSPLWLLVTLWGLALSVLAGIFDKKSHPPDQRSLYDSSPGMVQ